MFLFKILSRAPFWILFGISDFLFFVGFHVLRYRRQVVWNNLSNSFPDKLDSELRIIEKQFYRNLCDYTVETLKLLTISKEDLMRRMHYTNPEALKGHAEKGQSVILFASHQFNWEWLLASGSLSLPVAVDFVYQAQRSNTVNQFLLFCRTRFGAYAIQREKVAREVIKRKDITRGVAIVADQFPGLASDKRYWTNFLHQDTAFFQAINQVAILTQYPSYYGDVHRVGRGFYGVTLRHISTPPYDRETFHVVDNYASVTEEAIGRDPANWLWSHKRWKRPRPLGE
jgi:Kdo2-lipid IVA lauroyltransferase/acyltransferase